MTTPSGDSPVENTPDSEKVEEGTPSEAADMTSAQDPSKRRLTIGVVIAIVVALGLVLVIGFVLSRPGKVTVTGEFTLTDYSTAAFSNCEGDGGYSDLGAQTEAVLRDGSGAILGTANLGTVSFTDGAACTWKVKFDKVPADRDFYTFEVSRRGEIRSTRAELESNGWKFTSGIS